MTTSFILNKKEVENTDNTATTSNITTTTMVQPKSLQIQLTKEEGDLFDLLIQTALAYECGHIHLPQSFTCSNSSSGSGISKKIEIRIAGGWVRDKILQQESHDIDVALNCMSGYAFATLVQIYLQTCRGVNIEDSAAAANTTPSSSSSCTLPKIAVIQANPAQSKHLETATMKIYNMDIDFTNLRAEESYQPHSRIPTTQVGTPKEDAYRRDFTINSLFYNIQTKQIEDWTHQGIQDLLLTRQLVTPLNAHVTFLDDPLRVLRAIRFSVRYHVSLHPDIWDAATSIPVHEALHLKVSRERVGTELDGMLIGKGAQPHVALHLLTQLKLAGSVFCFPPSLEGHCISISHKKNMKDDEVKEERGGGGTNSTSMSSHHHVTLVGNLMGYNYATLQNVQEKCHVRELAWIESTHLIHILPVVLQHFQQLDHNNHNSHLSIDDRIVRQHQTSLSKVDIRILYLSTFLIPLRYMTYLDKKKKTSTLVSYIIRESIKFKNKDVVDVAMIHDNIQEMMSFMEKFHDHYDNQTLNESHPTDVWLRLDMGLLLRKVKDLWATLLLASTVLLIRQADKDLRDSNDQHRLRCLDLCCKLYKTVIDLDLDRCWTVRPLIDGRELLNILGISAGPQVAMYLDEQTKWMLLHPQGSRDECEAFLKQIQLEMSTNGTANK